MNFFLEFLGVDPSYYTFSIPNSAVLSRLIQDALFHLLDPSGPLVEEWVKTLRAYPNSNWLLEGILSYALVLEALLLARERLRSQGFALNKEVQCL